jgi:hypothetical protein
MMFNEKNYIWIFAIVLIILVALSFYAGGTVGGGAGLNRRYDQLNREYAERQRIIAAGIIECLGIVERAGSIIERSSASADGAVSNLREAGEFIKQGIAEREVLKMELDSLRSSLHGLRDMAGLEIGEVE